MRVGTFFTFAATSLLTGLLALTAHASDPYAVLPTNYGSAPAFKYGNLTTSECLARLDEKQIPYEKMGEVAGIETPVRLSGALRGITYKNVNPKRKLIEFSDAMDCRLVLALHDFGALLEHHKIKEVGYVGAYRADKTGKVKKGQRHPAGLALDIVWFRRNDGAMLDIKREFNGRIGARTCGPKAEAPNPASRGGDELRSMMCEAGKQRWFNVLLTPNYDRNHNNHVHLEVRRNIHWFLVH